MSIIKLFVVYSYLDTLFTINFIYLFNILKYSYTIYINLYMSIQQNKYSELIPWVEKYRPTKVDDIVLENINRIIINNIINNNIFPNLLLFGPPGTGKTTTIINLIKTFQIKNEKLCKELIIDLNASDDRGIDIIRTQIQQFVMSKNLFNNGTKFIILDEVDYMTKNAQHALKNIIQYYKNKDVRFCLICNYISRIEKCLQDECMNLRFTQLPKDNVIQFLNNIVKKENININISSIQHIYNSFNHDIRSMINYLQANQKNLDTINIINDILIEKTINKLITSKNVQKFYNDIYHISVKYNISRNELCDFILKYLLQKYNELYIKNIKFIMHNKNYNIDYIIKYIAFIILDKTE